jgi:hypothetical protein
MRLDVPTNRKGFSTTTRVSITVTEIRPHRWGWKVFESPGVEPVFAEKRQAIDYAECRACFRSGEIRNSRFDWQARTRHCVQRGGSEVVIADAHRDNGKRFVAHAKE